MSHSVSRGNEIGGEVGSETAQGGDHGETSLRPFTARGRGAKRAPRLGVWGPVLVRALSVGATMIGLAAIGTAAVTPKGETAGGAAQQANLMTVSGAGSTALAAIAEPLQETAPAPSPSASSKAPEPAAPEARVGVTADGKVVLNVANADELDRLPGVGRKRAEQIVELRARLGRFKSLNDLLRIRGIGVRSLKKMLPHLVLDPPPPSPPAAPAPPGPPSPPPTQDSVSPPR